MKIAIIGLGRLGLPMAALYASVGHSVIGVDLDDARIETLQLGTFRTDEPEVNDLLARHAERLSFTRLAYEAVLASEIVFVVVPTPSQADGTFNSQYVVAAARQIGVALHDKAKYTLVVVVSTLMPGQMDAEVVPALEATSAKPAGADFGVCYSPEFIALGRVLDGLRHPDYVLVGAQDETATRQLLLFYRDTIGTGVTHRMNFVNAELAKLATNAYLSLKIAYANVLGQICENIPGANVDVVTQAVGADHRIGSAYLRAGLPAGGVCLPRDLQAFATIAQKHGASDTIVGYLEDVSDDCLHDIAWWVATSVDPDFAYTCRAQSPAVIGILGTGYSATTSIEDGSYALALRDTLEQDGFTVRLLPESTPVQEFVNTLDAVVLALPLEPYRQLHFKVGQTVLDLWRILDPASAPEGVALRQFGVGMKARERVG